MKKNETLYAKFINYAVDTCDSFSFAKADPDYLEDDFTGKALGKYLDTMEKFDRFQYKEISQNKWDYPNSWSSYFGAMIAFYRCCQASKGLLLMKNSLYDWDYFSHTPENLCFYRDEQFWFLCVTHDKIECIINPTKEDHAFFESIGCPLGPSPVHYGFDKESVWIISREKNR